MVYYMASVQEKKRGRRFGFVSLVLKDEIHKSQVLMVYFL